MTRKETHVWYRVTPEDGLGWWMTVDQPCEGIEIQCYRGGEDLFTEDAGGDAWDPIEEMGVWSYSIPWKFLE